MIHKRILSVFILILACALMTGCFRGVYRIDINKDGSADLDYQISAAPFLEDQINTIKENMKNDGFTIVDKQEGNWQGFQAQKHLVKAEELHLIDLFKSNQENSSTDSPDKLLIEHGWFQDIYSFNSNIDLSSLANDKASGDPGIAKMMMSQIQLKLLLNLPVLPESHNANSTQNDGRLLEWNLVFGQNNQIQATAKVWNQEHIVITAIMVLIAIGFILFVWRKNRLSKNGEVTPVSKKTIISASVIYLIMIVSLAGYHFYAKSNPLTTVATKQVNSQAQVKNDTSDKKQDTAKTSENNSPEKDNSVQKVQTLLNSKNVQGTVLATSFGNNQEGFLSLVKSNNRYNFILYDERNQQIAEIPFLWKEYNFILNKTFISPVILKMTILNDKQDQDARNGVWKGNNHILPIYALYKFDQSGKVIPGMLTTGTGENPSHYQGFLKEQKNVDIANLFLTEMQALHENVKLNNVDMSFD